MGETLSPSAFRKGVCRLSSTCERTLVGEERYSDKLNLTLQVVHVFPQSNEESVGQTRIGESVLSLLHVQIGCQLYASVSVAYRMQVEIC
jgi:hypothetical protein